MAYTHEMPTVQDQIPRNSRQHGGFDLTDCRVEFDGETTIITLSDGSKTYHVGGCLHSVDGQQVIINHGTVRWYFENRRHRTDGPSVESLNGPVLKEWCVHGMPHRTDGPAFEHADGTKQWWVNGRPHRLDGPAIEDGNGYKAWWVDGERHRLDGPAIEYADGSKSWYVDGRKVDIEEIFGYTPTALLTVEEQAKLISYVEEKKV